MSPLNQTIAPTKIKMCRGGMSLEEKVAWLLTNAVRQPNGCLISHLKPNTKGYIPISFGRYAKKWRANRLVYVVLKGDLPDYILVCHSCDTRNCLEPSHLFAGTSATNTQDMMAKGRNAYIIPDNQKVSKEVINEICFLRKSGLNFDQLAEKFPNLSRSTIFNYASPKGAYYAG